MKTISLRALQIPFRTRFKHASAERHATQSVWAEAVTVNGKTGYGEGCPREYVTGESIHSALAFFAAVRSEVGGIASLTELRAWVAGSRERIDANPAAWCALELALLDAWAQEEGKTVEALLSLPPLAGPFRYTAVLGASELASFTQQLGRYRHFGMTDFKVKLSGESADDQARTKTFAASSGKKDTLRFDANNVWPDADAAIAGLRSLAGSPFAVEEPIRANDYPGMRRVAAATGLKIILDESFLRLDQLENLSASPDVWIINVRVSKMGGLLRSLAIIERAAQLNLPLIIGCQVGETSLLTRAALTLAQATIRTGSLLAQEGAFGTLLLSHDVVPQSLTFSAKGCLDLAPYRLGETPGWGLPLGAAASSSPV